MRAVLMALAIAAGPVTAALHAQDDAARRPAGAFALRGWLRTSIEASPATDDSGDTAAATGVPHDDAIGRELFYGRARYVRGHFEAAGAALLTAGFFHTHPLARSGDPLRASLDGEFREAYVGYGAGAFDLRAGLQRTAWGQGDIFSPNDVVNTRDLRDPVLTESELRYVPSWMVRADLQLKRGTLRGLVQPRFEPDRYDIFGANWALVQPDAPRGYRGLLGALVTEPRAAREAALLVRPPRPGGLSGTQGGLRFDWRAGRFDVTHYYHYGYHGTPNFHVAAPVAAALAAVDWTGVGAANASQIVSGVAGFIGSNWQRRQHVGLDVLTTAGSWVLRLDAAYQQPALFYDPTFNGWLSPTIETAAGLEYQTGSLGRTISIEARHRHIVHALPEGGLLFVDRDSIDAATLARWSWGPAELETRAAVGIQPASLLLRPQARWRARGVSIAAGAVLLRGTELSYGRWYRRNRGVYLIVRRDF